MRTLLTFALGAALGCGVAALANVPSAATPHEAKPLPPWAQSLLAPSASERSELGFIVTVQPKAGVCEIRTRAMRAIATFSCRATGLTW